MALPGHLSLDLFYPGEQAGQSCDSRGTWRDFFITCRQASRQGRIFLWSVSGWHGSVISAADIHGAVLALVTTGEPDWELCAWLP